MDKNEYFTCVRCKQKPIYRTQAELAIHQKIFHENEFKSRNQGGQTTQMLSELIKSRQQLQENINERQRDLAELELVACKQHHSIRLMRSHIKELEGEYQAVSLEIEKLKRIQKSIVKIDVQQPATSSTRNSKQRFFSNQVTGSSKITQSADFLALINSIKYGGSGDVDTVREANSSCTESLANSIHTEDTGENRQYQTDNLEILNKHIQDLKGEVNNLKVKQETDRVRLKKEVAVKEELRKMYDLKELDLSEKDTELDKQAAKISILEEQVAKQDQVLDNLTRNLATFQQKYKNAQQKIDHSKHCVQQMREDVSKLIGKKQVLEIENLELTSALGNKKEVIESLRHSENTLEMKVNQLTTLRDEYKRKDQKALKIVKEKERNIQLLRQAGTALEKEFNKTVSDLEESQKKERNSKELINEKERAIKLLDKSVTTLEVKVKHFSKELEESKLKRRNNIAQQVGLEQSISDLKAEVETRKADIMDLTENLETYRKNENAYKKRSEEFEMEIEFLTRERNHIRKAVEKTKRKSENMKREFQRLKKKYVDLENDFKTVSTGKLNLEGEVKALKECLESIIEQQEQKSEIEKSDTLTKLASRRIKIKGIRKDLHKAERCQQRDTDKFVSEIERLSQMIQEKDAELAKMDADSKQIQKDLLEVIDQLNMKLSQTNYMETDPQGSEVDRTDGSNANKLREDLLQSKLLVDEKEKDIRELSLKAKKEAFILNNANGMLQQEKAALERQLLEVAAGKLQKVNQESKKRDNNELQARLKDREQQIQNMEWKLKSQLSCNCDRQEDINALKSELAKCRDDNLRLQADLKCCEDNKSLEKDMTEITKVQDSMQEQKQAFEKKLKYHQENASALESKVQEMTERLTDMDNLKIELSKSKSEKDRLQKYLEVSSKEQKRLEASNGNVTDEIQNLRERLDDYVKEKQEMKIKLEESLASQRSLQQKFNDNQKNEIDLVNFENLSNELSDFKAENHQLKAELEESLAKLRSMQNELDESKEDSGTEQIERLEEDVNNLEKEKSQLKFKLEESLAKQKSFQSKLDQLERLREEIQECEHEKHELKIELEESLAQQRTMQMKFDELGDSDSENNVSDLHEQLSKLRNENLNLQQDLEESCQKVVDLEQQLQELEKTGIVTNVPTSVTTSNQESEILRRDLKMAKEQVQMLTTSIEEKDKQLTQSKQAVQDETRRDLKMAKEQVQMLTTSLQEKDKLLNEARQKMPTEEFEKELTKANKQVKILSDCLRDKEKEISEQGSYLWKREQELAEDKRNTVYELNETKEILKMLEAEYQQMKSTSKQDDEAALKLERENQQMQDELNKHKNLLDTANSELDRSNSRLKEFKQASDEHAKEKEDLQTGHASEVVDLRKEIKKCDFNYSLLKGQYEKDMAKKGRVTEAEKKALDLQSENENLEDDNYQLRLKIDGLEGDLSKMQENSANCDCKKKKNDVRTPINSEESDWNTGHRSRNNIAQPLPAPSEPREITSDESLDLRTPASREREQCQKRGADIVDWNSACLSNTAMQNPGSNQNVTATLHIKKISNKTSIIDNKKIVASQSQQPKPRLKELCGYKLYNEPDPSYPESEEEEEEEASFENDDVDLIEEIKQVDRQRGLDRVGRVPSYELVAQAYEEYQYQQERNKRREGGARCPSPVLMMSKQRSDYEENVVPFQVQQPVDSLYNDDIMMPLCQQYKSAYTFDAPDPPKQTTTITKGKKNKKNKRDKGGNKEKLSSLAPLSGALPPPQANCFGKPALSPIGGLGSTPLTPLKIGPIAPLLNPNRNRNADPLPCQNIKKQTLKKKKGSNLLETSNPLNAKPLPGLKNAPPTPCLNNPDNATFLNKYSPSIKSLGPMKQMPGPDPRLMAQHGHVNQQPRYQYYENEDYLDNDEDMAALINDLERTNAEINKVRAIQNQFYE